jgi:hypothetical protein
MDENALTPADGVDKAVSFFVIPRRYSSFGAHIGLSWANE